MYNPKILEILQNPSNVGILRGANAIGKAQSEICSDILKFYLLIEDGVVTEARFKTFGGATLIAVASVTTNLIIGKTVDEVLSFDTNDILREIGELPNKKSYCLNLVSQALMDAVEDYYKRLQKEQKNIGR